MGGGESVAEKLIAAKRVGARGALKLLKATSVVVDRVRPPVEGVVVLAYHRVGGRTSLQLDLDPEVFDDQMAELASSGRATQLGDAVAAACKSRANNGVDPVAVTFDDGTADFIEHALASLVRHSIPATYYIATDFVEGQRPFPDNGTPVTWGGLAEAVSTGLVTVGSHTHTHAVLDRLDAETIDDELTRSAALIEDRLGTPCEHFAYPKGQAGSPAADQLVREKFQSAALADMRTNPYGATDPHRLARSPIQRSDAMRWYRRKLDGGLSFEGEIRERLNERRYAAADN